MFDSIYKSHGYSFAKVNQWENHKSPEVRNKALEATRYFDDSNLFLFVGGLLAVAGLVYCGCALGSSGALRQKLFLTALTVKVVAKVALIFALVCRYLHLSSGGDALLKKISCDKDNKFLAKIVEDHNDSRPTIEMTTRS